jgi:ATP diphosphatase
MGPLDKLDEEIGELKSSIGSERVSEELGDLLFACVNLARHLKIDPEDALRYANKKFISRFRAITNELKKRGKNLEEASLEEMDKIWNEIKHQEDQ